MIALIISDKEDLNNAMSDKSIPSYGAVTTIMIKIQLVDVSLYHLVESLLSRGFIINGIRIIDNYESVIRDIVKMTFLSKLDLNVLSIHKDKHGTLKVIVNELRNTGGALEQNKEYIFERKSE